MIIARLQETPVLAKLIILVLLTGIVVSLFASAFFLVKDSSEKRRTLTGLKIRVALSVTLIAFILLSYQMGWITPHGVDG